MFNIRCCAFVHNFLSIFLSSQLIIVSRLSFIFPIVYRFFYSAIYFCNKANRFLGLHTKFACSRSCWSVIAEAIWEMGVLRPNRLDAIRCSLCINYCFIKPILDKYPKKLINTIKIIKIVEMIFHALLGFLYQR
jgi:hypothetical protein